MNKVMFYRKGHIITDLGGVVVFTGLTNNQPSINAAKRDSRKLQAMHGQGTLRVR